jgi:hypothetical protein
MAAPISAAAQDSLSLPVRVFALFGFHFTDEPFLTLIAVLGLVGLARLLSEGAYVLPIWLASTYLVEPRGGTLYLILPLAMMAATGIAAVVLPSLGGFKAAPDEKGRDGPGGIAALNGLLAGRLSKLFLGYVLIYSVMSSFQVLLTVSSRFTLKQFDLDAMRWAGKNTEALATFAVLTGEQPLRDASSEWFPAIASRSSVGTVFGYEWVNDHLFGRRVARYVELQNCASQDETCLEDWAANGGDTIDYVYLRKYIEDRPVVPSLVAALAGSEEYLRVYDSDGVVIYQQLAP